MEHLRVWLGVMACSLAVCWIAAVAIEDAGKDPYRSYQKKSGRPPTPTAEPIPVDPWQNVFPTKEGKSLR